MYTARGSQWCPGFPKIFKKNIMVQPYRVYIMQQNNSRGVLILQNSCGGIRNSGEIQ